MKRFTFTDDVPLRQDERGAIRVTGSRVTLDTIVHRYQVGDTIARIHEGFPTVSIAQISAIIDWYFNHQAEADEYLEEGEAEGEKLRREIESQPEYIALSEKIRRYREQRMKN
jgi:uncharacterized protein (DUF433 family)